MRTFVLSLKDMINKGLLSYSKKVGTGLDNCAGFRLTPDGLESIDNDIEELITPTELAAGGFANTDQSVATQVFKLNSTSEYVLIDNASAPKFGRVNAGITDLSGSTIKCDCLFFNLFCIQYDAIPYRPPNSITQSSEFTYFVIKKIIFTNCKIILFYKFYFKK